MRKFRCNKDLVLSGKVYFIKGNTYEGKMLNGEWIRFINDQGFAHDWNIVGEDFTMYFREIKEPSILGETPLIPGAEIKAPAHYDNSKGSLYKVASERNWNPYLFDIVKRLERGGKKDPLRQEIEKSIFVLQLWLEEHVDDK